MTEVTQPSHLLEKFLESPVNLHLHASGVLDEILKKSKSKTIDSVINIQ